MRRLVLLILLGCLCITLREWPKNILKNCRENGRERYFWTYFNWGWCASYPLILGSRGRGFTDATLATFGVGWAPAQGSPLVEAAREAGVELELMIRTGLVPNSGWASVNSPVGRLPG